MKTKNYFKIPISIAVMALAGCSSENDLTNISQDIEKQDNATIIHYSATVNKGSSTRATLSGENYVFETGDKLVITGTDISGELTINAEDAGKTTGATFEGDLTYTGGGTPSSSLELTAKLKSTSMAAATPDYTNAVTTTLPLAVQKYSSLTATSTYGTKSFNLAQNSTFIEFNITFNDGSTADGNYTATLTDESATPYNASGTVTVSGGTTTFYATISAATTLKTPKVTINSKDILFGSSSTTLTANMINHVTRIFQAPIDLSAESSAVSIPANSIVTVTGSKALDITIGAGSYVTLNGITANQITTNGNATLTLTGTNTLNGSATNLLNIASNKILTINGEGSLTISRGNVTEKSCVGGGGDLVIESGTIVFNGNACEKKTPRIAVNVRNFTMKGGSLTVVGGHNESTHKTTYQDAINATGNVMIEGGTVNATGSHGIYAAGNITINGGTVTASSAGWDDDGSNNTWNSGISAVGILTINGGSVTATGTKWSPGLGDKGTCGDILISGGTVTATGGNGAAAIGTGSDVASVCGNITIKNTITSLTVKKGSGATDYIGKGNASSTVGTVTIEAGAEAKITYQ